MGVGRAALQVLGSFLPIGSPLRKTEDHGFYPGPRHTKVIKEMVLVALSLPLRLTWYS